MAAPGDWQSSASAAMLFPNKRAYAGLRRAALLLGRESTQADQTTSKCRLDTLNGWALFYNRRSSMKRVKICRLGCFNHRLNFAEIAKWRSRYFRITDMSLRADITVDHFENNYVYPTCNIAADMGEVEPGTNLVIAVVDQPLEENFYMRRIDANRAVVSVFPVLDILAKANIPIENYIIRCIYEMVVFVYEGQGRVDDEIYMIPHHETRGCLFDMNVFIDRIVYSCSPPTICTECKARLRARPLPTGFIEGIERELRRIRKPLYYRIEENIKRHPVVALFAASALAVLLNVAASVIYDRLKAIAQPSAAPLPSAPHAGPSEGAR